MAVCFTNQALLCALTALLGCAPAPAPPAPVAAEDSVELTPLLPGHGSASRIGGDGVRLAGHRLDVAPDDWLLRDGAYEAVVSQRKGRVIALGRRGARNGLVYWDAEVFEGLGSLHSEVVGISSEANGTLLHIEKRGQTRAFTQHIWLRLDGPVLSMRTQLVAERRPLLVTLGETVAWGNTPSWVEGHGRIERGGTFGGSFIARDSLGVAYASCSHDGPLLARFAGTGLPGFHRSPRTGERLIQVEVGKASAPRTVSMAVSERSLGDAAASLPCSAQTRPIDVGKTANATEVEIRHCERAVVSDAREELKRQGAAASAQNPSASKSAPPPTEQPAERKPALPGYPYSRFALDGRRQLPLPLLDCLRARLHAPGHQPGVWFDPLKGSDVWNTSGILPQAGTLKWEVVDAAGKPLPAKIIVRGVGKTPWPDWGDDPNHGAARNFIYTLAKGRAPLPPGEHEVIITRGPEYSIHRQRVQLSDRQAVTVKAKLTREVSTPGWISADLHVHALPSFDGPALLSDRIRSLAAVNVEVAVATDHNAVTDYRPTIQSLKLGNALAGMVGDEVTIDDVPLGHFNVFPLVAGTSPIPWRNVNPRQLFDSARLRSPGGIIQVNHPSMSSIGYFDLLHLDQRRITEWLRRSPQMDTDFDAVEVFNGDHYGSIGAVKAVMEEWFALLDANVRSTATGNSDSHKVAYQEAGIPRNWVAMPDDDPANFNEADFITSIKRGHVIVSSGPFVQFTLDGAIVGDRIEPGRHKLRIEVDAPSWIDVSEVRLLRRGQIIRRIAVSGDSRPRLLHEEELEVHAGEWFIVEVEGQRAMPHLYRGGARPFAFTNPIWVDEP